MTRSKKIDNISSVEKLVYIKDIICSIDIKRIEAAVCSIRKESTIASLMRMFSNMNNAFAEEEERLLDNEKKHNENYSNKDNNKYSTAYSCLSCIKTSIFGLYHIMNSFSPKTGIAKSYYQTDTKDISFKATHSIIGSLPCQGFIFEDKSPCQKRLILEISSFLNYLDKNLDRCKHIVEDEKRISGDWQECLLRLENQIEETYQYVKGHKIKNKDADYLKDLLNVDNVPENATIWFHKLSPQQFSDVSIGLTEKRLSNYSETERKAFDNNPKSIDEYRRMMNVITSNNMKIVNFN